MIVKKKIITENRIVCFADVLGFKQMIEKYDLDNSSDILYEFQDAYQEAIQQIKDSLKKTTDNLLDGFNSEDIEFQMFSDNISISISYKNYGESFLESFARLSVLASSFQLSLMIRGFYIRGGIAKGSYFSDKNMIFSNALVKAYELESKKAIYPRIIVQQEIVDILKSIGEGLELYLISDWENTVFINPFLVPDSVMELFNLITGSEKTKKLKIDYSGMNLQLDELFEDVESKIKESKNHSIRSKYIWLLEFIKWKNKKESSLKFKYLIEEKI